LEQKIGNFKNTFSLQGVSLKILYMNKIILSFQLRVIYVVVFLSTPAKVAAQDTILNKYGLWVIENVKTLQKTIRKNPSKQLIDLKALMPSLIVHLRYAGTNNFMQERLYPSAAGCYLRKAAADSLVKVQEALKTMGLGLQIFDAYRPYSVTEKMWVPVQDDRYAADPKKGSGHNRGIAVDLTLIILETGNALNMGTGFDNFSDTAHHAFTNLPEEMLQNRLLLKKVMEQHGFKALDTEWWHYSLPNAKDFELLDIPFEALKQKSTSKKNMSHAKRKFN
jgi:D-alanyl-D-alanine dipeptidase